MPFVPFINLFVLAPVAVTPGAVVDCVAAPGSVPLTPEAASWKNQTLVGIPVHQESYLKRAATNKRSRADRYIKTHWRWLSSASVTISASITDSPNLPDGSIGAAIAYVALALLLDEDVRICRFFHSVPSILSLCGARSAAVYELPPNGSGSRELGRSSRA